MAAPVSFTDRFPIRSCDFKPFGGNPFLKLTVGRQLYYSNVRCVDAGDCDELEELWITMLPETRADQLLRPRQAALRTHARHAGV